MQLLKSRKNIIIASVMALLMFLMTGFSILSVHALSYSDNKLIVGSSDGFEDMTFSQNATISLYYDEETPITINWLKANPDFSFTINYGASVDAYGRPKVGVTGRGIEIISSKEFNYQSITTNSTTSFPESTHNTPLILTTGKVENFSIKSSVSLTKFQKVMNLVTQVASTLIAIASSMVGFLTANPLTLLFVIVPLIFLGIVLVKRLK